MGIADNRGAEKSAPPLLSGIKKVIDHMEIKEYLEKMNRISL